MMYEVLCTHEGFGAWFLRFVMWSGWSHSAVYDEGLQKVTHSTFWGGGVTQIPADEFFSVYKKFESREIEIQPGKLGEARGWLKAQVGKKYDWTALLSWIVRRDWQMDDSWFCSELTETFRTLFSRRRFRAQMSRITPRHQEMVA